jgi:hypothetical protein
MLKYSSVVVLVLSGCTGTTALQRIPDLAVPELPGSASVELRIIDTRVSGWWDEQRPERVLRSDICETLRNRIAVELAAHGVKVGQRGRITIEVEVLEAWWSWRRVVSYEHEAKAFVRLRFDPNANSGRPRDVLGRASATERSWDALPFIANQIERAIDDAMRKAREAGVFAAIATADRAPAAP